MWHNGKARFAQPLRDEEEKYQSMMMKKCGKYNWAGKPEENDYSRAHDEAVREMFRRAFAFAEGHYIGKILVGQPLRYDGTISSSDPYEDPTPSFFHYKGTSFLGRYFTVEGTPTNMYLIWQKRKTGDSPAGKIKNVEWSFETVDGFCFEEDNPVQLERMVQQVRYHLSYNVIDVHYLERSVTQPVFNFTNGKTMSSDEEEDSKHRSFSGLGLDCQKVIQGFEYQILVDDLLRKEP